MALEEIENLPEELRLALAYTPAQYRDSVSVVFGLDQRLARIVAATTEPMLGQMRISWWRDILGKPKSERPDGDVVLDAAGLHCCGKEAGLIALGDGWEHLLQEPPLGAEHAMAFVDGRSAAIVSALEFEGDPQEQHVRSACRQWAIADLAAKVSMEEERSFLVELAQSHAGEVARLPKRARGIVVLSALGKRALNRGGRPLMEGRGAALTAMKAGLIGS